MIKHLLFATIALSPVAAHADTPTPLTNPATQVAQFAASFGKAQGVTYHDDMVVKQTNPVTARTTTTDLKFDATINKPDKFRYSLGGAGTFTSDGAFNLAVNGSNTQYCRYPAARSFTVGEDWNFISEKVLTGVAPDLPQSLVPFLFGHINEPIFLAPREMVLTGTQTTWNGKDIYDIEYKNDYVDDQMYIDVATYQLVGAHQTRFDAFTSYTTDVTETLTRVVLSPTALPATDFLTTPPAGATAIALPPPPPPKPVTRPTTPRKSTRRSNYYVMP